MSAMALSKIYHHPKDPDSLEEIERLFRRARELHVLGLTRQTVQEYLRSELAYTLHKPTRRLFIRNHIYVAKIDAQW